MLGWSAESSDRLSERTWSPPESLAGKLERGLGSGFLDALEAPRAEAHALLVQCVIEDPRWDHQVDSRRWYYGELARRTALPVAPLAEALVRQGPADPDGNQWVTKDVLGHLAQHNNGDAVNALRDYVGYGDWWLDACLTLGGTMSPAAWEGLEELVVARIEADPGAVGSYVLDQEPFRSWLRASQLIQSQVGLRRAENERREALKELSTPALLLAAPDRPHEVAQVLAKRRSREDLQALESALHGEDADQTAVAVFALAERGDTSIEAAAIGLLCEPPPGKVWRRILALRAIMMLPPATVLPLARVWRETGTWELQSAADRILEVHATAEDVPWIRQQLARADAEEQMYATCSALKMISRFPDSGPYEEVRDLYSSLTYSYGRRLAAAALRATDPDFPTTLAFECLWDCEAETRAIGATAVALSTSGVKRRLAEMVGDRSEDEAVRRAAAARLAERD